MSVGVRWELVPCDHSGFYLWAMVVLEACTPSVWSLLVGSSPFDQGTSCSWWVRKGGLARVPINQAFSQRGTTLAIGQGCNGLAEGVSDPHDLSGLNCKWKTLHVLRWVCVGHNLAL